MPRLLCWTCSSERKIEVKTVSDFSNDKGWPGALRMPASSEYQYKERLDWEPSPCLRQLDSVFAGGKLLFSSLSGHHQHQPPASISQHNKETQTWRPTHHHGRERMMRQEDNLLMIIIDNFSPSFSLPAVSDQRRRWEVASLQQLQINNLSE